MLLFLVVIIYICLQRASRGGECVVVGLVEEPPIREPPLHGRAELVGPTASTKATQPPLKMKYVVVSLRLATRQN